jgi:RNA polymerase sigma-70 factor (ECF subfamily)
MLSVAAADARVAEDITSEAFARALERWERVSAMESPSGWTYRVGINLLRRQQRRRAVDPIAVAAAAASLALRDDEFDPDLWHAVGSLPTRMRLAIALRYVADLTEADVASAMGVTPGSASATLAAARRRLAERLRENSFDHEVRSNE